MRQKQAHKSTAVKKNSAFRKLGPKEQSTIVFTGSPLKTPVVKLSKLASPPKQKTVASHPALVQASPKKLVSRKSVGRKSIADKNGSQAEGSVSKPRRYRPGTKALREIRQYQRGTDLLIQRAPFQRLVREVTSELTDGTNRFTADALECLQTASEAFIVQLFEDSVLAMIHARRVTLMVRDMQLIRRLRGI